MIASKIAPGSYPGQPMRRLLAPAVATALALAILLSLGFWQLERKAWKDDLVAQIAARAYEDPPGKPVPEASWPNWRPTADEFRRVRVEGTFRPDKTVPVHGLAELRRGQAVQGFYLFVPLERGDGSTVVVNRGFVPTELREPTMAALAGTSGRSSVVGLVRAPEGRGWFVPENAPQRGEWFVRSLEDIAAARRLDRVAPFYLDADAALNPEGWPKGGQTQLTLRNNHMGYALTWFGLAATLVGVFTAFALRPRM